MSAFTTSTVNAAFIADKTQDFTGRDWVFKAIDDWLAKPDPQPPFFLTGGPGTGKSAIAARLTQMSNGQVEATAYPQFTPGFLTYTHFCHAQDPGTLDPLEFVRAISQQLVHSFEPFRNALSNSRDQNITFNTNQIVQNAAPGANIVGVQIETLVIGDLSATAAFERALRQPLQQIYDEGFDNRIIILVDGLDVAYTYSEDNNILQLLRFAANLPHRVRLILTSRPDPRVLALLSGPTLDLIADAPKHLDEVHDYALNRLSMAPDPQRSDLAARLASASAGNFLYTRYILDDWMENGLPQGDLSHLELPEDLPGIYREFLQRELARNEERWADRYRPVLAAVAVARAEGLSRQQIAGITGLDAESVGDVLRKSAQYLVGAQPDGPFHIYHQSFRDFLLGEDNPDYAVNPQMVNLRVGQYFLRIYTGKWVQCTDKYALSHTPSHLIDGLGGSADHVPPKEQHELAEQLGMLLSDLGFMEAKVGRLGIDYLLADLRLAVPRLGAATEEQTRLAELLRLLDREAYLLRDWRTLDNIVAQAVSRPAFFAQQMLNWGKLERADWQIRAARQRLMELELPFLEVDWQTSNISPALLRTLTGHRGRIKLVAITSDGTRAVSASDDGTLKVWDLASGQELLTLKGHVGPTKPGDIGYPSEMVNSIEAVAITPDGTRAVSASGDNTLKVWDLASGQELYTLSGHTSTVWAVAITPDGTRAVSASGDNTLKVWDLASGQELYTLGGHTEIVEAVAITPDGTRAVSASRDRTLKVWDLASGQELYTLSGHSKAVISVSIIPDGTQAVSGSWDNTLKVWDLASGQELYTLSGHGDTVVGVFITPDGTRAVSSSEDHTLKVWDLSSGRELHTLKNFGSREELKAVAITPDSTRVVSAFWNNKLTIWDLSSGQELYILSGHSDIIVAVAITPDGTRAVSASWDETLKVWDLSSRHDLNVFSGHAYTVAEVAITPDGTRAVSASYDGTLRVWDLYFGHQLQMLIGHKSLVESVAITPDGTRAVSASWDDTLRVWDLNSGQQLHILSGYNNMPETEEKADPKEFRIQYNPSQSKVVHVLAIIPDGTRAISAAFDNTLRVWDLDSGQQLYILSGHSQTVLNSFYLKDEPDTTPEDTNSVEPEDTQQFPDVIHMYTEGWVQSAAITPDGTRAVSASGDKTLRVWDLYSGQTLHILTGHTNWVQAVAITPDGTRVVSASNDHLLAVWNLDSGQPLQVLRGHTSGVSAVAITPDGTQAVSASYDSTLKVWDLYSGGELYTLTGHSGSVEAVAITPDGTRVVSTAQDNTLKVWNLATGTELVTIALDSFISCLAIARNSDRILVGSNSGNIYSLHYITPERLAIAQAGLSDSTY